YELACAMAACTCLNLTNPMLATNVTITNAASAIRLAMSFILPESRGGAPSLVGRWPRLVDFDVPVRQQRSRGSSHLGLRLAVIGERGDLVELGARQIVLARENQEVRGEAGGVAVDLGAKLDLRCLPRAARGFDPLPRGLERRRRVQ